MKTFIRIAAAALVGMTLLSHDAFSQNADPSWGGKHPGFGPIGAWGAHGNRMAIARRFLNDASFRDSLEANLNSTDKQTIEKTVDQIKGDIATLKKDHAEFMAARVAHDTGSFRQFFLKERPVMQQIRADRKLIISLLKQSKTASLVQPTVQPIYPNPVRIGATPATISYTLKTESNVTITLTDASGKTVQEIASGIEGAGEHTVSIGPNVTKPGAYYVTIQTGTSTTTQKLVAVE